MSRLRGSVLHLVLGLELQRFGWLGKPVHGLLRGSKEELVPAAAEDKLKLYGLFKQAEDPSGSDTCYVHLCKAKEGDNTASAAWSVQWETKAKWDDPWLAA